jgi:MYXO-CTERM domain-containing protein
MKNAKWAVAGTSLLASLVLVCLTMERASADPSCIVPQDDYLLTCTGCTTQVQPSMCTLTCEVCYALNSMAVPTSLDLPCNGTISNWDGVLVCHDDGDAGADGSVDASPSDSGSSNGSESETTPGSDPGVDTGSGGGTGLGGDNGSGGGNRSADTGSGGAVGLDASIGSSGGSLDPGSNPSERFSDVGCGCRAPGDASGERAALAALLAAIVLLVISRKRRQN